MHWMDGFGGGWMMFLWWAIIIAAIIFIVKLLTSGSNSPKRDKSAIEILNERYAKGEISKEEFEEKKQDILG